MTEYYHANEKVSEAKCEELQLKTAPDQFYALMTKYYHANVVSDTKHKNSN